MAHEHGDALVVVMHRQAAVRGQQIESAVVGSRDVGRGDGAPVIVSGGSNHGRAVDDRAHHMGDVTGPVPTSAAGVHDQIERLHTFRRFLEICGFTSSSSFHFLERTVCCM